METVSEPAIIAGLSFFGWFAALAFPCDGLAAKPKDNRSNGLEIGSFPTRWQRPSDGHALHDSFCHCGTSNLWGGCPNIHQIPV